MLMKLRTTRVEGADSEEKHEPVSDFDTVVVDSLKALDPNRPIREADLEQAAFNKGFSTKPPASRHRSRSGRCYRPSSC
jgi:hypothetical protein